MKTAIDARLSEALRFCADSDVVVGDSPFVKFEGAVSASAFTGFAWVWGWESGCFDGAIGPLSFASPPSRDAAPGGPSPPGGGCALSSRRFPFGSVWIRPDAPLGCAATGPKLSDIGFIVVLGPLRASFESSVTPGENPRGRARFGSRSVGICHTHLRSAKGHRKLRKGVLVRKARCLS